MFRTLIALSKLADRKTIYQGFHSKWRNFLSIVAIPQRWATKPVSNPYIFSFALGTKIL
jgi:hypothetical protein